jgi:hypothetical protein
MQAELDLRRHEDQETRRDSDRRSRLEFPIFEEATLGIGVPATVSFTAFWPRHVSLAQWTDLLVYLSTSAAIFAVLEDSVRRLRLVPEHIAKQTVEGQLKRGTEVTVVPEIEDAEINPSYARVAWLEAWNHVDFRFRLAGESTAARAGQVSFYVGPLLIGSMALSIVVGDPDASAIALGFAYRNIFVSYSHKDRDIVDQLERAATAIGDTYLRDTKVLRSGEEWSEAVLAHIDRADVFQLCWSEEAKQSIYVDQEWRHAHRLARRNFIRPMYWKEPMVEAPPELRELHFKYVPFP